MYGPAVRYTSILQVTLGLLHCQLISTSRICGILGIITRQSSADEEFYLKLIMRVGFKNILINGLENGEEKHD